MEKGILARDEIKEQFMRAWPIVSSWLKEQFMRKCVMAIMRKWWSIWVDAARIYPPPLMDSSDEEPPPQVWVSSSDSSDDEEEEFF